MSLIERLENAYLKARTGEGKVDTIILSPPDYAALLKSHHENHPYLVVNPRRRDDCRYRGARVLEGNLADDSRIDGRDTYDRFVTIKLEQPANADT